MPEEIEMIFESVRVGQSFHWKGYTCVKLSDDYEFAKTNAKNQMDEPLSFGRYELVFATWES